MEQESEVNSFEYEVWRVSISVTGVSEEGHLCGAADVFRDGERKCRLASGRSFSTKEELIVVHEAKARAWIDEWLHRDHTGTTGFGEIPTAP